MSNNVEADYEAVNHSMQELGRYQQAVLLVEQLSELMGYLAPDLEAELKEYREAVSWYTEKLAGSLAQYEKDEDSANYILDAIEYADTYRQRRYVYGILAPIAEGTEAWGMVRCHYCGKWCTSNQASGLPDWLGDHGCGL